MHHMCIDPYAVPSTSFYLLDNHSDSACCGVEHSEDQAVSKLDHTRAGPHQRAAGHGGCASVQLAEA